MALKSVESPRGSFPVTGANTRSPDLLSNHRTQSVFLTLTGTLTLGGVAATGLVNDGSLLGAIQRVVLSDNGSEEIVLTGAELLALSTAEGSAGRATRLRTFANGAVTLREHVRIPLSGLWPLVGSPIETPYVQRDGKAPLNVLVSLDTTDANGKIVATAGTAVLSAVTATIEQEADTRGGLVVALPRIQARSVTPIPASVSGLGIELRTPWFIRGLLIYGTTANVGDVSDIITRVAIRSDTREVIGPQSMPFPDAIDRFGRLGGGGGDVTTLGGFSSVATGATGGVYLMIDFLRLGAGRLSNIISSRIGTNLKVFVDAQPSGVAGALGSAVAVLPLLLRRDGFGLVIPSGPGGQLQGLDFSLD